MIDEKTGLELPQRMEKLQRTKVGYIVPWFVQLVDGEPDFRIMDGQKLMDAIRFKKCWICGDSMGKFGTFVVGPMCAVNRTSSEPPSHYACAEFAAKACPFLTRPEMIRRETGLPEETGVAGEMIKRNPGVTLLWTSVDWYPWRADNGVLFDIGSPQDTTWYAKGKYATRQEVTESIESGLPILMEMAEKEGPEAVKELDRRKAMAMALVPAA